MEQQAPDRNRLRQVQTTDLTESRLNDDFVYWLKKNGSTYLSIAMLVAAAVLGYNYWQTQQIEKSATAWSELATASESRMPEPLEQVAKDHSAHPQLAMVALIAAGDLRLGQIQRNELAPAAGETPAIPLDDAARKIAQDAADESYTKAAEYAVGLVGGNRKDAAPVLFATLFGRAAIAETRGDVDASRKYLEDAAALAGADWPSVADVAKARLEGLTQLASPIPLPLAAEIPAKTSVGGTAPLLNDELFNTIIQEQAAGQSGGDVPVESGTPAPSPNAPVPPAPEPTNPVPTPGG
jgi:predicted negative regulator of RcsB-dependent stress response